jgi:hypothetical protein
MSSRNRSTLNNNLSTTQLFQPSIFMSSGSNVRTYLACGHCREAPELNVGCKKTNLIYLYCAKVFTGGDINRFKQYLVEAKGKVEQYHKYSFYIRH